MPTLGAEYLASVLRDSEGPCVSIYLPTHRSYPDNQQDAIRYKNLMKQAEEGLSRGPGARDGDELVTRLRSLAEDERFWSQGLGGAAILASKNRFDVFALPRTMPERAEVDRTFHIKPLIRHVQSADRFQVLGLSRERVALFEGNRYELHPLRVPGIPLTLTDALGEETEPTMRKFHTVGPGAAVRNPRGASGATISHGQGGWSDEIQVDTRRFFLQIDRKVLELVSNPSGLPLIVAGLEENIGEFRALSANRFVTAEGVTGDWTNWPLPEIRERAWKVFEKLYLARLAGIREDYGTAGARQQATADLADAARAAAGGRVGTLLIDADRTVPGSIDMASGELRPASSGTEAGDMLDDLAELAMRNGTTVTVVPSDQMPTSTGLAAMYRY